MQLHLHFFVLLVAGLARALVIPNTLSSSEISYVQGDPKVTHRVDLGIAKGMAYYGHITIALFGEEAPKTVENFMALANMTKGYGYKNVKFHRIVKDFVVQGGDFEKGDGTGGYSIYGKKFPDETFAIPHNKKGRLLMANLGPNTNGAQFFITTTEDCLWLNGKHVVFGQLVGGMDIIEEMNNVTLDENGKPSVNYFITGGQSTKIDTKNQKLYEQLKKEEEIYQAALRGETTLINDQVHPVETLQEDSMGGYIFLGAFCLVVLLAWRMTKKVRRSMGVRFKG